MLTLYTHFIEFKFRCFYVLLAFFLTFFISSFYAEFLIYLYTIPFLKFQLYSNKIILTNFIFTNISDAFYTNIYVAVFVAAYFTVFYGLYNILNFLQPGLFKYEKLILYMLFHNLYIHVTILLYLTGQFIVPIFLNFFLRFEKPTENKFFTIRYEAKLLEYIMFNNKIIIFSVIICIIPLILFYLLKLNLLSFTFLVNNRRFFIFFFFIIGGIFSPPDIYSQLLVAFPLSFCFELNIFLSYLRKVYLSKFDSILFKKRF